jgi:hypothetical protein
MINVFANRSQVLHDGFQFCYVLIWYDIIHLCAFSDPHATLISNELVIARIFIVSFN